MRLQALSGRETGTFPSDALPEARQSSAVLLLFWPAGESRVEVVFTQRPDHMPTHAGQVSFPGGRRHAEDKSAADTALREAREELGIDPGLVTVMGRLDDAWSIAGHHVIPYVGWLEKQPDFAPNPAEVEAILIGDVETLMRPEVSCEHRVDFAGKVRASHAFKWDGGYVWGLTADILLELLLWIEGKPSGRADLRLRRLQEFTSARRS